ncbi:universal stress protein UspA [Hydrogenovibrio crunogenus]|uniref:Universal stress protein UspA n=1 Tax=Hydrogenovibrio crunogenus TaxID=39765 RepID=A0A4P7P048_9GAMM|nr:STAS/SEC14 domain-containing protein [Hydrogenovibrio crunogenus]QBZ83368.1 universal stress protein UspA [Hydrogenovibrio crunogenus]
MKVSRRGFSLGIDRIGDLVFLSMKVQGKLTHDDYSHMTPMIDSALKGVKDPKVKALVDLTEMEGWELRAAWDDFKMGLSYGGEFEKIAIIGHKKWQDFIAKVGSWFISGKIKRFESEEEAISWLSEDTEE